MATATFHSFRGEKSALVLLRVSAFAFAATPVYVPKEACPNLKQGDKVEIPDGFKLVPMTSVDEKTGEVTTRTADNGQPLMMLQY